MSSKHAYLSIPADFSVGAVNEMLRLGRENGFGALVSIDYRSEWDWCLCFENGIVWSWDEKPLQILSFHRFRSRYAGTY